MLSEFQVLLIVSGSVGLFHIRFFVALLAPSRKKSQMERLPSFVARLQKHDRLTGLAGNTLGCLVLLLISAASAEPPVWPEFQNGGALSLGDTKLPVHWSPEKNIAWSADIEGYGQSTPIVAHDQIVVTSTRGKNKDDYHVTAYSIDQGKKQWQVTRPNPSPFANTPMVSRAAPSAIATAEGFVAFFEGGLLLAINRLGDVIWEQDLVALHGKIDARHGIASSLESNGKHVFVWVERSEDPYVLAIDPATGKQTWKAQGVGATSWASPRLVPVGDRQHLVCSASGKIIGLDPDSGKRLWEFDDISNNSSCTPIPVGDGTFLIGASDGRGETTPGAAAASNGLVKITQSDDGSYHAAFQWRAEKATSTFGSPVVAGGTAAIVNRTGVLYRLDLQTGAQVSADRTGAGGIWATPIVNGDLIYLFGYKGTTSIFSLADGKEIAQNRCWPESGDGEDTPGFGGGDVLYAAAPTGVSLIIRRGDKLFSIEAP